ncbi:hypothetical protein M8H51_004758, partial [Escherichia coli]|nr:hypothetical protein [Escherichia coli]
ASGISINITTSASIEVVSSHNALENFLSEFGKREFKFDYAKVQAIFNGSPCSLDIKTTSILSDSEVAIEFLERKLIRNDE